MIYRHHIAPPRAFSQFSHDLIRHPRLSSDAVRLLTWQLSLLDGARESLSRTAERARIGACAFTRAKRQLKEEGFVHERRLQGPGGHWITQQLVSNVPLSAVEAAKILGRMPVHTPSADTSPQVAPSPRIPTVGIPTPPPTDGHPKKDPGENTSHRLAEPERQPKSEPDPGPAPETPEPSKAARALVAALPRLSPDLRRIPRGMHDELARHISRWLAAGHTPATVRTHIPRGLPDDGTPVHRPGGLLRYLLRDVPPAPDPDTTPIRDTTTSPHQERRSALPLPLANQTVLSFRSTPSPRGARLARRLISCQMDAWGRLHGTPAHDSVELIAAELAANAVTHGRVPGRDAELRLSRVDGGYVRIEVSDARGERWPEARDSGSDEDGGRGLLLVAAPPGRSWASPPPSRPRTRRSGRAEAAVRASGCGNVPRTASGAPASPCRFGRPSSPQTP
ncbi:ATP-binding protein [Streptomyces griseoincarnatus]